MTLTLEIAPEIEAALTEKARRRGIALDAYLLNLAMHDQTAEAVPKITAASVRGKYAGPGVNVVDDFMAERRAEGLTEEEAFQRERNNAAKI